MKARPEDIEAIMNLPSDHPFNLYLDELLAEVIADLNRNQEQKEKS